MGRALTRPALPLRTLPIQPLRVYVSAGCVVCDRTRQLVTELHAQRPAYPVELIDLDQPDAVKPAFVFGTPSYVLGERIISLGNPALAALLTLLDTESALEIAVERRVVMRDA